MEKVFVVRESTDDDVRIMGIYRTIEKARQTATELMTDDEIPDRWEKTDDDCWHSDYYGYDEYIYIDEFALE